MAFSSPFAFNKLIHWLIDIVLLTDACSVPMDIPANFTVHLESINSTGAEFSWRSVDSSRFRVQGVFTGYQVMNDVVLLTSNS